MTRDKLIAKLLNMPNNSDVIIYCGQIELKITSIGYSVPMQKTVIELTKRPVEFKRQNG